MNKKIEATIAYVREELKHAEGGHDWFHIERVHNNAINILKGEPEADAEVVRLIALLHDIADSKFHKGDETVGPRKAKEWLESLEYQPEVVAHVVKGIENISFKGGNFNQKFTSKELEIVQDADRLDAIGAIGITRVFNYGGFQNNPIHNPEQAPRFGMSKEEYKAHKGTSINHFYEKLLLLKDLMHTETGKRMAEERHRYMEGFLAQFYAEWEGSR
ncbi:HD domain-containing protein [Myroides fluvii]|uniref:HD domain-containing protein n=1 Tax=Myroides fluvii TaxID=2572594 RepID=UPI00131DCB09|nr:HD domain-containing protein [Myroides fluvii]